MNSSAVARGLCLNSSKYRAEWAWEILFASERIPGMVTSMLHDFKEVYCNPF